MNKTTEALKRVKAMLVSPNDSIATMYCYYLGDVDDVLAVINEALADHSGDANEMVIEHKCGGCAKTAADGWALYCVECWEKAKPVKQEPVAWIWKDKYGNERLDWEPVENEIGLISIPLYFNTTDKKHYIAAAIRGLK